MHAEQRLVDGLIKHWRRRKGEAALPAYERFMPEALGGDVMQHCCTFTIQKTGQKNVYIGDFLGENVRRALGREISGEVLMLGRSDFPAIRVLQKADDVLRLADPLTDEGHFVNEESKIVKFRSCLLPFGRGDRPTYMLLGMSWRAF